MGFLLIAVIEPKQTHSILAKKKPLIKTQVCQRGGGWGGN
jgi:hypothetical protein